MSNFQHPLSRPPRRLLIFYTYSGDGEAAEINRAQHAVVPFAMPDVDDTFVHPRDGSILRPTQFPVQLYCRARPWFHIAVYDVESLEVRRLGRTPYNSGRPDQLVHLAFIPTKRTGLAPHCPVHPIG